MNQASPLQPGVVINGFTLVRELGRGGMGSVWEVERAGARYALKAATLAGDPELGLRFQREAQAQARVDSHPNVVRVHTAGVWGGASYLIMDLAPGGDLEARLEGGPLPWREAGRLVADLARGLAHVHAQGVLHRDLKPANVLFDGRGTPQLVDFGVAKLEDARSLTATGALMGTPAYMAPEQANCERVDARADVYGLGAILYHCLSGRPPFEGGSAIAVLEQVLTAAPAPLPASVPRALSELCLETLAKPPAERPSLLELGARLELLLEGASARRGRSPLSLALGVLAGLLAGAALGAAAAAPRGGGQPSAEPSPVAAIRPTRSPSAAASPRTLEADRLALARRLHAELGELPAGGPRLREWSARLLFVWRLEPRALRDLSPELPVSAARLLHQSAGAEPELAAVRLQRDLILLAHYLGVVREGSPAADVLAALAKQAAARPELNAGLYPLAARYGPTWLQRFAPIASDPKRCGEFAPLVRQQPLCDQRTMLESAVIHYPQSAGAWRLLGDVLREQEQGELNYLAVRHAHLLHPAPINNLNWGLALHERGQDAAADALFNDVMFLEQTIFKPYAVYAKALLARDAGHYRLAAELLVEARRAQQQVIKAALKRDPATPPRKIAVWRANAKLRFWALYRETMVALQDEQGVAKADERLSSLKEF